MSSNRRSTKPKASKSNLPDRMLASIYRLKIWQMILILLFSSSGLYLLDYLSSSYKQFEFLKPFPVKALADACFTSLIVAFTYEWLVRRESQEQLNSLLLRCLEENRTLIIDALPGNDFIRDELVAQKTSIIQAIPTALLTNREVIRGIIKPDKVEEFIRTGLQIKLGDEQLGNDIYDGLLKKTVSYEERWSNYRHAATLTLINDPNVSEDIRSKYYQAYVNLRYETCLTKNKLQYKFKCLSTIDEYNLSLRDGSIELRWLFEPTVEFPRVDESAFNVRYVTIDGLNLDRRVVDGNQGIEYVFEHSELVNKIDTIVTVNYQYEVKLQKRGHLMMITLVCPTKNISIEVDYASTDIHYMNVLDFFVSTENPSIRYTPGFPSKPRKVEVELEEWGFPKGGVVFVWVLSSEMTSQFIDLLSGRNNGAVS